MVALRQVCGAVIAMLVVALGGGCTTKIVPPKDPVRPVVVYVSDYGRHSSLLLPTSGGHLMEYAFGDWNYYALKNYRWYVGATALLGSDGSGLGRRIIEDPGTADGLRNLVNAKRVLVIEVEGERVMALLDELDERFTRNMGSMVYNDWYQQWIVKDETRYSVFNTCNGMTAQWLERLGCDVRGMAVLSNFRVVETLGEEARYATTQTTKPARPTQATAGTSEENAGRRATTRVASRTGRLRG